MTVDDAAAEEVRETERRRMKALVECDLKTAREIIAENFELVAPPGIVLTRERYLGDLASGTLRYFSWEAVSPIAVRVRGDVALVRYEALIDNQFADYRATVLYWFTDVYEKQDGCWRIVMSQGTRAFVPPPESARPA